MRNEEKAEELAQYYSEESDYKRTVGYDCAIAMAEWKDKQFYEEQNVLLNILKTLIAAGGDTKIIEQLIDTLDNQTIIEEDLIGLLK